MTGKVARHVLVIAAQCGAMGRLTRLGRAARELHAVLTHPALGGCLRRIGAHGSLVIGDDLTPADVRGAVAEAVRRARADGAVLVVALLGHGFTPPQRTELYYMVGDSTTASPTSAVHVGQLLGDAADEPGVDGVIALVDTCHAAGAVPDTGRIAGGMRSGRARLAVLTAAAADQDARDLRLSRALTELIREGAVGAGSTLHVDRTLTEALRERISGQIVGRVEYDNDPYALRGLWLARNVRHARHTRHAADTTDTAEPPVGPLGREALRQAVEMWRAPGTLPERLTHAALAELRDFARTGGRVEDETGPAWRARVDEVSTALLQCAEVADLVDDTLATVVTSDLLRAAGRLAGLPPAPEGQTLLRDLLEYAALRAQPADGPPGQGLARFLAAVADRAGRDAEHCPLRAWAQEHRLVRQFNDALEEFAGERRQQGLRLVVSLAGAWTDWPEEVEAWLVRGGTAPPDRERFECGPADRIGVGRAIGKALAWARGRLPAPELLVNVDVAAPAHLVARWRPEEEKVGRHLLGAHHAVVVRWSGRLDPAADNAEINDAARKSLQAMAACGTVPVEWVDAGILRDRSGLEFGLRAGQYATAVGVDHHPEDLPEILDLLLPYAPIVLWPRADVRPPGDDRLRTVVRQQWHRLPGGFVGAYRDRWKAHENCPLCLGDIRAVWHDEPWLEFCRPFENRVVAALEEES